MSDDEPRLYHFVQWPNKRKLWPYLLVFVIGAFVGVVAGWLAFAD